MVTGHPTAERLLSSAVDVLDCTAPADVTAHMVLALAGASKGSMYHHYRDFDDLMDRAYVTRFATTIDSSIATIGPSIAAARTGEECLTALVELTRATQGASNPLARRERIWMLGLVEHPGMREGLGVQQQRLTDAIAETIRHGQSQGWFREPLDPHATAVFLQACSLGQILGDVTSQPVSDEAWNDMIGAVVRDALITGV